MLEKIAVREAGSMLMRENGLGRAYFYDTNRLFRPKSRFIMTIWHKTARVPPHHRLTRKWQNRRTSPLSPSPHFHRRFLQAIPFFPNGWVKWRSERQASSNDLPGVCDRASFADH